MSELAAWLLEQIAEDERDLKENTDWDHWMIPPSRIAARIRRIQDECDSKRRLVNEHAAALANRKAHPEDLAGAGWLLGTIRALKLLALPYADRPGYREEWKLAP